MSTHKICVYGFLKNKVLEKSCFSKNNEKRKEEEKIANQEEKIHSELKDEKDKNIFMSKQLEHYQLMLKDKDNCISNKDEYISKLEELLEKALTVK